MDVFDNRFVVYIDGVFIVEYMDNCDPIMRGSIGIISYSSTARFTYFSVELNQSHIPSQTYSILTKKEQYALKQIYQSSGSAYWYSPWNLSILESADACNSSCGIVCHTEKGISSIMSLSLANNNISGTITNDIQHL
eukprot:233310_1